MKAFVFVKTVRSLYIFRAYGLFTKICSVAATRHDVSNFLLCSQHALENEELTQHLGAAKDAQRQLTAEVRQSKPFQHNRDFLQRSRLQITVSNLGNNPGNTLCVFLFLLSCVSQLRELEDKYAECMEMLHEAQEELKNLRNKTLPLSTPRRFHSLGLFPMVSHLRKHARMLLCPCGYGDPSHILVFPSRTL